MARQVLQCMGPGGCGKIILHVECANHWMPDDMNTQWQIGNPQPQRNTWTEMELNKFNNALYHVLVDRTEEEVVTRVSQREANDGIKAYQRVYLWMAGISGQALSDCLGEILKPTAVRTAEDVADALSEWLEQINRKNNHRPEYRWSVPIKVPLSKARVSKLCDQFENI